MPNVSNGYAIKDAMHLFISDNNHYENKMDTFNQNIVNWDEFDNQNRTVDPQPNSSPTNCSDENNEEILKSKVQSTTPDSVSSTDTQEIPPPLTQSLPETSSNDELSIMLDLIGLQGLNLRSQLHMAHVRENELLSEFIHQSESPAEILRRLFLEVDSLRQENRKLVAEFDQTKLDNQQQKQVLQDVLQTVNNLKTTTMPTSFEHELKQELKKHIPENLSPSESLSKDKETRIVYSVHKRKENGSISPPHTLPSSRPQNEVGKEELGKPILSDQHQITTLTAQNHILQLKYATCKRELATKVGELNALIQDARDELHYTKKENGEFKRLVERNMVKMQDMAERIRALESALEAICYDNELLNSQLDESLRILKNSFQEQFQIPQELARENFILQQHIKNLFKEKNVLKKKLNAMKRRQSAESMYDEGSPLEETPFHHFHSGIPKSMARSYLTDNPRRAWHKTKEQHSSSSEHETIEKEQPRGKKSRSKSSKKSPKLVTFGSENKEEVDDSSLEDQNLFHSDVLKDYLNLVESSKHNTLNQISCHLKPQPSYSTTPEELRLSDLQDRSSLPLSEQLSGSASSWSYYAIAENNLSTSIPPMTLAEPQSFQYKGHELLKENKKFLEHLKRKSQEQIMQILKQDQEIDREIETLLKHASRTSQETHTLLPIENTLSFQNCNKQEKGKENHIELNIHSRESSNTSLTSGISSSHDPSILFNLEQLSSGQSPITAMVIDPNSKSTLWKPTPVNTVMSENNTLNDICNIQSGIFLNETSTEETEIQELETVNMEATNTGKTVNIEVVNIEAKNVDIAVNIDGAKLIASNNYSNTTDQFREELSSPVFDHNSFLVNQEKEFNEENNPIFPCQEISPSVPLENILSVPLSSNSSSTDCENSAVSRPSAVLDTPNNLAKTSLNEEEHSAVCLSSSLSFERESFA